MAASMSGSCQPMARCSLRMARQASRTNAMPARFYATQTEANVARTQETEELPSGFDLGELSSMAHVELQTHRELRNLARLAAWEMPLLSKLSKPFEPPTLATPLRWRYTTYLGELHPAASKVVVEFCLRDLKDLTEEQKQTLRKLAGARWYSETDIIKMSCESFQTQAQNKRYLGDTIAAMMKEAKEGEDKFEDVPIDMRVQAARLKKRLKRSPRVKFPVEWRMTTERRAALDALPGRKLAQIEAPQNTVSEDAEQQKAYDAIREAAINEGELQADPVPVGVERPARVVSGVEAIETARRLNLKKSEQAIMTRAAQPIPQGKMGKKEMGQQPVRR